MSGCRPNRRRCGRAENRQGIRFRARRKQHRGGCRFLRRQGEEAGFCPGALPDDPGRSRQLNGLGHAFDLVGRQIVPHHHVPRCQRRRQAALHITKKHHPIRRAVEDHRRFGNDTATADRADHRRRLPMTVRHPEMTSLATKRSPVSTRHVRLGARCVQENQTISGRVTQAQFKLLAAHNDIGRLLF